MREGKELILATKDFANDFKSTSWWCILSTMFLLVIALSGTIWNINLAAKFLSSLLAGLLMVRLFVIFRHQTDVCKALGREHSAAGGAGDEADAEHEGFDVVF